MNRDEQIEAELVEIQRTVIGRDLLTRGVLV